MTQTIVITSGKGGVGKTNISVNTAIELALRNYRTCLLDADLGLANVNILLGIDPENSLDDYIFGKKNLHEVILSTEYGIDIIPGSSGIEKMANLEREDISNLVSALSLIKDYDFFLIDTASGISRGVMAFCLASRETIIVITAEATSLTDAYALLKVMALNNYAGTVKIVVNRSPSVPQAKETYLRFKEVVNRHLKIQIAPVGIILNDPNIELAITRQKPAQILYPDSLAPQCIKALISNLLRNESPEQNTDNLSEFWQRYFDYALPENPISGKEEETNDPNRFSQQAQAEQSEPPSPASTSHQENDVEGTEKIARTEMSPAVSPQNDIIIDLAQLPSPTPLLSKALELQALDQMSEKRLLEFFAADPVLMAQALKFICDRAPEASLEMRVTKRQQLVKELGAETLTKLLCNTAMEKAFFHPNTAKTADLATKFWFKSYQCALLATDIAEITAYPYPEEAFIAGLIHDLGSLAMHTDRPEIYLEFSDTFDHKSELLKIEKESYGLTHAELSAKAFRAYNFNSFLADAAQYHTASISQVETAFNLVKIVFLASYLVTRAPGQQETADLGVRLFGIPSYNLSRMADAATEKSYDLADRLGIQMTDTVTEKELEETEHLFRCQVKEYSMLQGALPIQTRIGSLTEVIQTINQAFALLFGTRSTFCFLTDSHQPLLKGFEYPGCFAEGTVGDMQFSLHWEKSLIVNSFLSGEIKIALDGESSGVLPLADRQLLQALGTEGFVSIPMVCSKQTMGIMVFGILSSERSHILQLQPRLLQYGAQAARNIISLEKLR